MCSRSEADIRLAAARRHLTIIQGTIGLTCGKIRGLAKFAERGGLGRNPDVANLMHDLLALAGDLGRLSATAGLVERDTLPGLERIAEAARVGDG